MAQDDQPAQEAARKPAKLTRITLEEARKKKGASNLAKLHADQQRERKNGDKR
jgi:hypothetical protein